MNKPIQGHDPRVLSGSKPAMEFYIDRPDWLRIEVATSKGTSTVFLQKVHFEMIAGVLKRFAVANTPGEIIA